MLRIAVLHCSAVLSTACSAVQAVLAVRLIGL